MALRTKESLQRMFEERKRIQEKKQNREERKKQKKQLLQAIYRHQDQILKKALQDEKKQVMDNLQALLKKRSQNVRKCPSWMLEQYQDTWQLCETNESDLYHTREELMDAEDRGEGKINWTKWDELIAKNRE